jgi:hypothetical protein
VESEPLSAYAPKPPLWRSALPSRSQGVWLVVGLTACGLYFGVALFESPFLASPAAPAAAQVTAIENVAHANDGGAAQIRYRVALSDGSTARMQTSRVHRVGDRLPVVLMRGHVTGRAFVAGDLPALTPVTTVVRAACPAIATDEHFFADRTLQPAGDDAFRRHWYSKHLAAMEEPSLSCGPLDATESYRFLWLRTFHPPVAVRVSWAAGRGEIVAVLLDGAGGYEPGKESKRVRRAVTRPEWETLRDATERSRFWTSPTGEQTNEIGLDGAQWIVEGRRGGRHHVVDRWSPDEGGAHRALARALVAAAGLDIPPADVY